MPYIGLFPFIPVLILPINVDSLDFSVLGVADL